MEVPFMGGARSVKRPYHQQHAQESTAPFVVTGVHALLFDDDMLAAFINSPAALLPWNGDQSLLIDRYDVRHLLQDLSGIRKRRPAPPLTDCTEEELNHERFGDLQDALSIEEQRASEDLSNPSAGGYQAVPFSYSEEATENGTQTGSTHRSVGFCPPFPVPDFLLPKLPPSEKLHQIMVGTAKFVKEHGGQSEFLLKVKQGSNPMFGFLNVDHRLHEYYRFLVEHPELLQPVSQSNSRPEEATHSTGEGLSLLGFAYGSGDEDDDKALRLESTQGHASLGSSGAVLPSREGLTASNGGGPSVEKAGGIATQGKAFAATSQSPKLGEDSQPKVNESAPRALSLLNKKKKSLVGTKEFIQPNKKIVSQLMANEAPRKEATDTSIRLPRKSESKTSSWHSVPTSKDLDYGMSSDAAAAAVFAATRGARGLRQDSSNNNKSSSSSGISQKALEANRQPSAVKGITLFGLGQTDVRLAKAVAEAAAIAASHEADSADALLTPAEKLKAERLRKAKMFAAMIKSGKCVSERDEKPAGQLPAATSTKSDDVRTDSFPGLVVNGKAVSNGRAISTEESPHIEEVEDSDINKSVRAGITDLMNKRSLKERVYRKHESKEQHKSKGQRSDSEESEHRRKRKSHNDHGAETKQRHSKRKKHRAYDSESADSGCSSGNESKDQQSSKSQRHHHRRRKRSHHEKDEIRDGKHRQSRLKICNDDDLHSDSPDEKHRRRKRWERGTSSSSEDEAPGKADREVKSLKAAIGEEERLPSPVPSKRSIVADNGMKTVVTTEVPAEIRAKVRAMLLSTL